MPTKEELESTIAQMETDRDKVAEKTGQIEQEVLNLQSELDEVTETFDSEEVVSNEELDKLQAMQSTLPYKISAWRSTADGFDSYPVEKILIYDIGRSSVRYRKKGEIQIFGIKTIGDEFSEDLVDPPIHQHVFYRPMIQGAPVPEEETQCKCGLFLSDYSD